MTAALPCVCGCPPGRHLMSKRDCRSCQTCSEYEPAEPVVAASEPVVLDVTALLGEVQGDVSREAELAARLADVERQLTEALEAERRCKANWHNAAQERDAARNELAKRPSEAGWTALKSESVRLAAEVDRLTGENRDLSEHIPCGWCDGVGVAPGERFGRDADGAPNVDEDLPCPEGCEIPAWLQAERNDAADDARLLAEARQEIERLGVVLEQAEQYARDLQERGIEVAVERLYDTHVRYLCAICGGRYREHHNHPCGRLVPVRVRITFIEEYHRAWTL